MNRRDFIQFFSTQAFAGYMLQKMVWSPTAYGMSSKSSSSGKDLLHLPPQVVDEVITVDGLNVHTLVRWGDVINTKNDTFGFNNDYIAFFPLAENRALLWVNHENVNPIFVSGYTPESARNREHIDLEMYNVGGTIIEIARPSGSEQWGLVPRSEYNRRITATTKMPLVSERPIQGQKFAMGTLANCAGGVTPWGTVLTCEENYDEFYGEVDYKTGKFQKSTLGWEKFYPNHPHLYGWVVEVNPKTGDAKKHTSLGRFAHECATVKSLTDKRVVVYSGDDKNNGHLYKFISKKAEDLSQGTLFAADLKNKRWLSLDINASPLLKKHFKDQTDVLIHAREAASMLGATELDRPEDIEIHPVTGDVYIALTNNKPNKNYHGQILKIRESNSIHDSLNFEWSHALVGGQESAFSCPDNMTFDNKNNLWITSDISGTEIEKNNYKGFGNNSLYYCRTEGSNAGNVQRLAIAPIDAEFTGPCFSSDNSTLFLSVQHPGENSSSLQTLTSHWPAGGDSMPTPAVIQLTGPLLQKLL